MRSKILAVSIIFLAAACGGSPSNVPVEGEIDPGNPDSIDTSGDGADAGTQGPDGSDAGVTTPQNGDSGTQQSDGGFIGDGSDAGNVDPGGTDAGSADAGVPNPPLVSPKVPEVDPGCVDGKYAEVLPSKTASLSNAIASYSPAQAIPFIQQVLGARYPLGWHLVSNGIASTQQNCVDTFLPAQSRQSAQAVLQQLSVVVHECGHFFDVYTSSPGKSKYVITEQKAVQCTGLSYVGANASFARSRIMKDAYAPLRPACASQSSTGCDRYANVYLDGNPDDSEFDSGDQGFNMLLEEVVQYVNSLATDYAFVDQLPAGRRISSKDGILTLLWYMQRYLRMARLDYPAVHQHISQDPCWRDAILTVWGRAWLYLETTAPNTNLGLDDARLFTLVRTPELLAEIERLRTSAGCP